MSGQDLGMNGQDLGMNGNSGFLIGISVNEFFGFVFFLFIYLQK